MSEHLVSFFCSVRFALAILGFFMFLHLYAQRVGMSVAIVCMVNHTTIAAEKQRTADDQENNSTLVTAGAFFEISKCSNIREGKNDSFSLDGPFVWEKGMQGHILGAFFYGYMISQIPGGLLAEQFGGKWVLFGFLGLSSFATLLTPLAARLSVVLLIFLRVLVGIGSGALFPAMHAMWGQWAPPLERSKLAGITYAGGSSVVCLVFWALLTSNTPSTNRFISAGEKHYILSNLKGEVSEKQPSWREVPWLQFAVSGPVWALIVANFCMDWGLYTLLTNIPTFYKEVLLFDITSNGLYSALPFIGLWANMNISPVIADYLRASNILSTVATRKLFNSIGLFGGAVFLVALSFLDCTQTGLAVALLTMGVTVNGCTFSGYFVNHMDIAPKYAGTLMGISNGLAATSGFIAPYIAAVLTKSQTRESWQIVFFIAAGVYSFGAVVFIILAAGDIQQWAVDSTADGEIAMETNSMVDNYGPIYKPRESGDSGKTLLSLERRV